MFFGLKGFGVQDLRVEFLFFGVWGLVVWGMGLRVLGFGFRDCGFGFLMGRLELGVWGLGFSILGLGVWGF